MSQTFEYSIGLQIVILWVTGADQYSHSDNTTDVN